MEQLFIKFDSFVTGGERIVPILYLKDLEGFGEKLVGLGALYSGSLQSGFHRVFSRLSSLYDYRGTLLKAGKEPRFEKLVGASLTYEELMSGITSKSETQDDISTFLDISTIIFEKTESKIVDGKKILFTESYLENAGIKFDVELFENLPIGAKFMPLSASHQDWGVFSTKLSDNTYTPGRRVSPTPRSMGSEAKCLILTQEVVNTAPSFMVREATFTHPVHGENWTVSSFDIERPGETIIEVPSQQSELETELQRILWDSPVLPSLSDFRAAPEVTATLNTPPSPIGVLAHRVEEVPIPEPLPRLDSRPILIEEDEAQTPQTRNRTFRIVGGELL